MRLRLPLRRRLLLSVLGAVAVALVVLIAAFNLVLRDQLDHDANNALSARASAELGSLHVVSGKLVVPEAPDAGAPDTQSWVFARGRVLEQPPSDHAAQRAAERLSTGGRQMLDLPGSHTRLYAVPVEANGARLGTVVAGISTNPYDSSARTALIASLVLGAVLLVIVAIAARLLISAALRPVADMTAQAAAWSRTDTGGRFDVGTPRDELAQLATTLNALLDRVASSLRHEQRFSAELSHELRSPLASVIAEAQLALRHERAAEEQRSGFEHVLSSAQQMSRTLDTLLIAARIEHGGTRGTGDAASAAHAAARDCEPLAATRGVTISVDEPPAPITVGVDTEVAERMLVPLLDNACRYGNSIVRIGIERVDGSVVFRVEDDGTGVPERELERIFEPGRRETANGRPSEHGAGLGLPLARRLARAAGGDVQAEPGSGGRFTVRLPRG